MTGEGWLLDQGGALHGDTCKMRDGAFQVEPQAGKGQQGQKQLSWLVLGNKEVSGIA